jgi:hypothetical protein
MSSERLLPSGQDERHSLTTNEVSVELFPRLARDHDLVGDAAEMTQKGANMRDVDSTKPASKTKM